MFFAFHFNQHKYQTVWRSADRAGCILATLLFYFLITAKSTFIANVTMTCKVDGRKKTIDSFQSIFKRLEESKEKKLAKGIRDEYIEIKYAFNHLTFVQLWSL